MDDSLHSSRANHPRTFDEVIARGFPHAHVEALQRAHEARVRDRPTPGAPKLARCSIPGLRPELGAPLLLGTPMTSRMNEASSSSSSSPRCRDVPGAASPWTAGT